MGEAKARVAEDGREVDKQNNEAVTKVEAIPFVIADHLDTQEMIAGYLNEFLDDEPAMLLSALREACMAKGMVDVAVKAGLARESLYKALRPDSRPRMETFLAVIRALDLKLVVVPIDASDEVTE